MARGDRSWAEKVSYLCKCGTSYRVTRHRWVDAEHQTERRETVAARGPLDGECPSCGAQAQGRCSWLELSPQGKKAVLVLGPHQRAELTKELSDHLQRTERYPGLVEPWMLRPDWRFESEAPARAAAAVQSAVPQPVAAETWGGQPDRDRAAPDAFVTDLVSREDEAVVDVVLGESARRLLSSAALRARPALLRSGEGYPMLSIRVMGSYLGQTVVIDAVADPSRAACVQLFSRLSQDFRVRLQIRSESAPEEQGLCREIASPGVERNAKFCLDSALESLALLRTQSEFRGSFAASKSALRATGAQERMRGAQTPLAPGSFQHLLMPEETRRALHDLNEASRRENLRHLLEVDGLGVAEYEDIRQRVLTCALEQGLCAPPRFWPRILKLGLAADFTGYAQQLAENRQRIVQSDGDDLEPDHAQQAKEDILLLCARKRISLPPMLEAFLRGRPESTSGGPGGDGAGEGTGADESGARSPGPGAASRSEARAQPPWSSASDDLHFEHALPQGETPVGRELAQEIDDEIDRLFPRHSQSGVEFMPGQSPATPLTPPSPRRPAPKRS